jgi:hypothetical protein
MGRKASQVSAGGTWDAKALKWVGTGTPNTSNQLKALSAPTGLVVSSRISLMIQDQNNKIPPGRSSREEPRKDPIRAANNQKDVRGVTADAT